MARTFKCYPYLLEGACLFRGKEILTEPHFTNGKKEFYYYQCLNEGINGMGKPCKYCLYEDGDKQNHWLIPRHTKTRNGEVRVVRR